MPRSDAENLGVAFPESPGICSVWEVASMSLSVSSFWSPVPFDPANSIKVPPPKCEGKCAVFVAAVTDFAAKSKRKHSATVTRHVTFIIFVLVSTMVSHSISVTAKLTVVCPFNGRLVQS